jgi:NAD(P)-dependent dehydrogenase (short-subunit alcohol dehydrogenase family)
MTYSLDLRSRYFLVTGGAGFLGFRLCEKICDYNGIPIAVDIDEERLEQLRSRLKKGKVTNLITKVCDITSEVEVANLFNTLTRDGVILDGLINNAANNPKVEGRTPMDGQFDRLESQPFKIWRDDLSVTLDGSYLVSKYFVRHILGLQNQLDRTHVVLNISSDLGIISPNHGIYSNDDLASNECERPVKPINYSVTKAGIIGLSRYLATYCPSRLRSNVLCPGGIFNNQPLDFVGRLQSLIPMGRMAEIDEIVGPAIFMVSDLSSYVNGATLSVDGGRACW